jgi:NADPH:quinone reductase-like Zn-dependent oxidoreductase
MKAYQIGEQAGIASLTLTETAAPVCGPGQAVLRVSAVCLNHRDLKVISGEYGARRPANRTPGSDGVGEVIAVGEGVGGVKVGDRVTCGHFVTWLDGAFSPAVFGVDLGVATDGWLAEQILVPAAALVKVPDGLSDQRAAPLPSAGLTAWHAIVEVGRVKAGDLVLALGTGGVSIFALQIAKLNGARVAITSSSDEKLDIARAMGADFVVNYRTRPDWAAALLEATGGRGADIIVETGGGATLSQSIAAAAPNARIALIGSLSGSFSGDLPNFASMIGKNLVMKGIAAGNRRMLAELILAADAGGLTPRIDKIYRFEDAQAAYAHLQSGASRKGDDPAGLERASWSRAQRSDFRRGIVRPVAPIGGDEHLVNQRALEAFVILEPLPGTGAVLAVGGDLDHLVEIEARLAMPRPVEAGRAVEVVGLHRRGPTLDQIVIPPDAAVFIPGWKVADLGPAVFPKVVVGLMVAITALVDHPTE